MQWNTYVTRIVPEQSLETLRDVSRIAVWNFEQLPVSREELLAQVRSADALITMLTDRIDAEVFSAGKNLKIVANVAVGHDNIDMAEARNRGVIVTNTPDVLTETTADLAFALLLATARKIPQAAAYLRAGKWKTWSPLLMAGQDVHGATLGIVGLGRIGVGVAQRARGFGMRVLYHNRNRNPEAEAEHEVAYRTLDELLRESDFVVLLAPLTEHTRHLIALRELSLMKRTACLINVGRGPLVDETALYEALKAERLFAAGLDVFEKEPIGPDHPLLTLPNVVALPHIGSASIRTRTAMTSLAAANVRAVLTGESPLTPVV